MKVLSLIVLLVLTYVVAHAVVFLAYPTSVKLVASLTAPSLAMVAGLLIGAVGVFLGGFGNLYSALKLNAQSRKTQLSDVSELVGRISNTTNEVKHNVFLVISVLVATLVLPFIDASDIPGVTWPFEPAWLSKTIVLTTINFWLTILAFIAIFDCIGAMFLLHQHYEEAIKDWINNHTE